MPSHKRLKRPDYPIAKCIKKLHTVHGHTRVDNYYWLRNRDDPNVIKYLQEENKYAQKMLKHTEKLQNTLLNEMKSRIQEKEETVPYKKNGYVYYTRYEPGQEYPVYLRKKIGSDVEQTVLNCNNISEGCSFFANTSVDISPDNRWGLFGIDVVGRRIYTLMFIDLETGVILDEKIENTSGNAEWCADSKTIFYTRQDPVTLRANLVYRHIMGHRISSDHLVYDEKDPKFHCSVGKTKSEKYITIYSSSTLVSEVRILESDNPSGRFRVFEPRRALHTYTIDHINNKFYILSNMDGINRKLYVCGENSTRYSKWKMILEHRSDVLLDTFELFDRFCVISEKSNASTHLRVFTERENYYIRFDEDAYDVEILYNPESSTNLLRFEYNSLTTPSSVYEYNMDERTMHLLKMDEVDSYDKSKYTSERHMVKARDGTLVPISLVYRTDMFKRDGSNPLLQYGYGSYGITINPTFNSNRVSLLDRGFVYCICHIRGGEDMGRQWYENGKLLNKMNTFTDFIDCSLYLIEQKFTSSDKLFAMGGSAGGLLMGAVINMRPDLYKGVIADVPFVDVVTTMLDPSIPLTTGEYDEWGNPEFEKYYKYMLSYSPYDNVCEREYPNLLVMTGLHDSQVQYWEPAKWVAKLRSCKKDENLLLLITNMDAGHGGASGRYGCLSEIAIIYAFILNLLDGSS